MSITWDANVNMRIDMAFGAQPYDTAPTWTDVSDYIHGIDIRRGSVPSPTPTAAAGTATVVFDNDDGRFDPNNTLSPYAPDVTLTVRIRIRATYDSVTYPLFFGWVTGYTVDYPEFGKRSTVTVECVDAIQLLNSAELSDFTYSAESTDTRIGNVLDDIGFPAAWRTIATGVGDVEALTDGETVTALQHLRDVATAEAGDVFVDAGGSLTFTNRVTYAGGASSKGTFGPSDLQYVDVSPVYNDDYLYNRVVVTGTFDTAKALNQASIDDNLERVLSITGVMASTNAAKNVAQWNVRKYKAMDTRVSSLEVMPQKAPAAMWPVVLDVDLRDAIRVKTEPPGSGDALSQTVAVTGVAHSITLSTWTSVFQCLPLASVETDDYWVLGTSALGTGTRLA